MAYKEDLVIPKEIPLIENDIEEDFREWYENHFRCESSPRSARYYQMRTAWKAAKKFYEDGEMKT